MKSKYDVIYKDLTSLTQKMENRKNIFRSKVIQELKKDYISLDFYEISISEFHAMEIIAFDDEINGIYIADRLGMTRGAISKIIKSLEKKNLIIKYQNITNKKKIFYKLTELGKIINEKHTEWHTEENRIFTKIINKYSLIEQETILKFIKELSKYN